jgi:hypothetical protein
MTYTELVAFLNTNVTPPVTDSQKLADNDKAVLDFLLNQNSDDFPDWTAGQTFNTDATGDGKYCKHPDTNGRKRIFETKTSGNTGNTPPTDPGVTENTHWIEISQSASASIPEYVPGVYGTGLKMVFFEDDIYKLQEPVRPFTSTNLLTELAAGKWLNLTRKRAFVLATGDLDTSITQTGDYYCEAAVVNKPPGAFSGKGFLRAVVRDSQNQSQVFIPSEHFTLFYRRQNAGTWHGWKSVATLDDLVGLYDDRGAHDASVTKYPSTGGSGTSGAILKGDIWRINVAGNGLIVGQTVRALIDSPGTSDANWHVSVGGGTVTVANQATAETAADATLGNRNNTDPITARGFRWAWEVVKNLATTITGAWTFDGANTLITGYALTVRNSAAALIMRTRNDQSVEFGGSIMEIEVPDAITAGNAAINFRDLTGEQFALKDKSSNKYLTFEKLASGTRIVRNRRAMVLDRGIGMEVYNDQVTIVTTTTAAGQNVVLTIAIPTGFMLSFKAYHMIAYATDESVVSADDLQVTAKNVSGTVTSAGTSISHQRLPGTLNGSFNTNISGTDFQLRFQNETGTGKTYTIELDYSFTLIAKPI